VSAIGWVDFSSEHREKVKSVIDLLSTPGVVDELGIGVIRDSFSDSLFPGISTIQTRAKYFLTVPRSPANSIRDEVISMSHPLHNAIGQLLRTCVPEENLILDPACGGDQNIPLFISETRSRATEYCDVDALILKDGQIKIIVEIDESNRKPTQVAGKFLTSAMATHYIHDSVIGPPVAKHDAVWFLQVLSTTGLEDGTQKPAQWDNLRSSIRALPPIGNVEHYELLYGTPNDFTDGGERRQALIEMIGRALA